MLFDPSLLCVMVWVVVAAVTGTLVGRTFGMFPGVYEYCVPSMVT